MPAKGVLKTPVMGLIVPPVEQPLLVQAADQSTFGLKLPVPCTVAVQVVNWPVWIEAGPQLAVTPVTTPAAATVSVVEPFLLVSWLEVAVMVTWVVKGTVPAVKRPLVALMVPPLLAVQVTVELKAPVPCTEAVHWLV